MENTRLAQKWSARGLANDQKMRSNDISADLKNRIANQVTEQLDLLSLRGRCHRLIDALSENQVSSVLEFLESISFKNLEVNHHVAD